MQLFDTEESELAESFGRCVALHRKAAGLTQIELCHLAGVAKPFLSRVENGRTVVNLRTMARIAKALGLEFHVLCQGVDISHVNLENREYRKARPKPAN